MKQKILQLLLLLTPMVCDAKALSTEMFGMEYTDAVKNIEQMFGKPKTADEGVMRYENIDYDDTNWDEAYFKFSDSVLTEVRFYKRQPSKEAALRHVETLAHKMEQDNMMTKDYEDRRTVFYKGGRSPMEYGHLFTIFVSPYKGGWSSQLRYGPFVF